MRFALRLRAWQLFLLFGPFPVVVGAGLIIGSTVLSLGRAIPSVLLSLMMAVYASLLYGWLWSVGVALNGSLQETTRWRTSFFAAANIYVVTYVLFFLSVFWVDLVPWAVLAPLHASAMLASLYSLCFVTRTLMMSRFGSLRVLPTIATFLLLWVYPVGVWIIQPWVNRVVVKPETRVP